MSNPVLWSVWLRGLCSLAAIAAAAYLAFHGKDGWGWMIFLAVITGAYSLKVD